MKHVIRTAALMLALALSACGTLEVGLDQTPTVDPGAAATLGALQTRVATLDPASQPLTMDSSADAIRLKMLRSYATWRTLFIDGVATFYAPDGSGAVVESRREQIWIDQSLPAFRLLSGPAGKAAATFAVSDGDARLEMDLKSGSSQVTAVDNLAQAVKDYHPAPGAGDVIDGHPLAGTIGSRFDDQILPSGLAQREGSFQTVGVEKIAGRECLIVDWFWPDGTRPSRYWIDTASGVLLKAWDFGKGGGDAVQSEIVVDKIAYDPSIGGELFSLNPASLPQFSDLNGTPSAPASPGPAIASGSDPLGEVYFFTIGGDHEAFTLLRLPGSCVIGSVPCPEPEKVGSPVSLTMSINQGMWAWSSDGRLAAFTYAVDASGAPSSLFIFDPVANSWTSIADFPIIDIPMWSHDGQWVAFRAQDGQGQSFYYAVHPDGTGMVELSDPGKFHTDGQPYAMDGWIGHNAIIRSGRPGAEDRVYLVRPDDGLVRPLFETLITKALFYPSPDGSLLAYDDYDYEARKHTLRIIAPDGAALRDLATFKGGSFYPIVWSPDGNRLAFADTGEQAGMKSVAYVLNRDGRGLQQVYDAGTVTSLTFSPDGRHLLIEDSDVEHIFVVDLVTLESHLLQAPGLSLADWWRAPSWRP